MQFTYANSTLDVNMLTPKDKHKRTFFRKSFAGVILLGFVLSAFLFSATAPSSTVYATHTCDDGTPIPHDILGPNNIENFCSRQAASQAERLEGECLDRLAANCGIMEYVIIIINILSAVVGVIVVIMIVIGGIQYTSARDNPQAVAGARERIMNALLALVFYLGITAFLQWVVPGGVFAG